MRLHRFFVEPKIELQHDFWLHDERLLQQWRKVLRFESGQQVVLFDGARHDRLYRIVELTEREAHLQLVTDFTRNVPHVEVYLLWSMLKKDKNDWVLQKCTELGVSHFWPILADRSEKTGFNIERAQKIIIEASEQCGRSDIPSVREPMHLSTGIKEVHGKVNLLVSEKTDEAASPFKAAESNKPIALLVGPEGGWSDTERLLFKDQHVPALALGRFTYRAETAAVVAASQVLATAMV